MSPSLLRDPAAPCRGGNTNFVPKTKISKNYSSVSICVLRAAEVKRTQFQNGWNIQKSRGLEQGGHGRPLREDPEAEGQDWGSAKLPPCTWIQGILLWSAHQGRIHQGLWEGLWEMAQRWKDHLVRKQFYNKSVCGIYRYLNGSLLCILTSFRVLHAPKSWSKHFLSTVFVRSKTFSVISCLKSRKNIWKWTKNCIFGNAKMILALTH